MRNEIVTRKKVLAACCLCIVLGGMMIGCGCTQQPAAQPATTVPTTAIPAPTVVVTMPPKEMMSYNESANNSTVNVTAGKEFRIDLKENPTTGYMWNATVSSGLEILNDTYTPDAAASGMVGVGGTHTWIVTGKDVGMQKFEAVYMRSWENVTGSEDAYVLNVNVIKA